MARQEKAPKLASPGSTSRDNDSHGPGGSSIRFVAGACAAANTNGPGVKNQLPRPGSEPATTPIEADSDAALAIRLGSLGAAQNSVSNHAPLIRKPLPRGRTARPARSVTSVG